jgi:hypothetical protein
MVRTIITPQNTDLHITIPEKYVGKRVEVTFLDLDEVENKTTITNNASRFKGLLTNKEADKFNDYLKKVRKEWDRDL